MADSLRLRGQEVAIRVTRNGVIERTMTAIKSLTWTPKFDILREGYLGETTDRRDDIYRGCAVEITFHPESQDAITLVQLLRERASRRTAQAAARISVTFVCGFANGERPRVTITDLKFGDVPFNMGARDQFVDIRLSAEADDFTVAGL